MTSKYYFTPWFGWYWAPYNSNPIWHSSRWAKEIFWYACTTSKRSHLSHCQLLIAYQEYYHTTETIFGKDQRMPVTRYISYPTLSASRCILSGSECVFNVNAHLSLHVYLFMRSHARGFSVQQRCVWMCCFCLCLCLLSTHCRGPDIFHIRPWVRRDALCQAVSVYLMSMHACPCTFTSSRAVTLLDFPRNRGTFECVVFACFCAYFQHIAGDQIYFFISHPECVEMHYIDYSHIVLIIGDLAGWQNSPTRTLNSWTW